MTEEGGGEKKKITLTRTCPACGGKVPVNKSRCPECGENVVVARQNREAAEAGGDAFAPEKAALNRGVVGGIAMIVIAGVWFYLGWQAGYIYYYPPIFAVIGVVGVVKGLAEGNVAGARRPAPRRAGRRR